MDVDVYLPMFLAEAQEHLQSLNLCVVRIEEQPDDRETLDEIFRAAHSMKGMSATMGFAAMAALTHEMEDVFELLRQRSTGLGRNAIDVLLECLDKLEAAVQSIEETGAEQLEAEPLVERLRELVRERTPDQEEARDMATPEVALERADGEPLTHVRIILEEECSMPAVRAFMAIAAAGDCGTLVASKPEGDLIDTFEDRLIEVWLTDARDDEEIVKALSGVQEVATVEVAEAATPGAAAAEPPAPVVADAAVVADLAEVVVPEIPESALADVPEAPAVTPAPPAAKKAASPKQGGGKHAATVRVDAERLDQLMHHMGELVVQRTLVESLVSQASVAGLNEAMADLTRVSQALQAMVMQVRMVPVEAVFLRFPRLVRDLSTKLTKQVDLKLVGQETELDRTVVDALGDPLVHLVRNSLDHGLEPPADREAAGKPATGTLEISARHAGGSVVISVRDDGRGLDPAKIASIAVKRGLISEETAAGVDAAAAAELLFEPGFSTAEVTSDISGRGVGMDAVRTAVRELGGDVVLESVLGKGTTALIRLPLTLAIVNTLLVEAAGSPFAVPLDRVERTLSLTEHTVRSVAGNRMLVLRDGVLPLVDAGAALQEQPGNGDAAVIVRAGRGRIALAVEKLVGQRELVTRPLPGGLHPRTAISSGAVLSDGRIALIVDCDALATSGNPAPIAA